MGSFGKVNELGFICAPYRKVEKANGRVTDEIVYLTADEEDVFVIAQANSPIDENGYFTDKKVDARFGKEYIDVDSNRFSIIWTYHRNRFGVLRLP